MAPLNKYEIGVRVGAIFSSDRATKTTWFLGYGTYRGEEIPDAEAGGLAAICRRAGRPNPKIELDDGRVVWGAECWWGAEASVRAELIAREADGWTVKVMTPEELAEYRKAS